VVLQLVSNLLDHAVERGQTQDWKTIIAEYAQREHLGEPVFTVHGQGPDHHRLFTAEVAFGDGDVQGVSTASSKKHAENMAARDAMQRIDPGFLGTGS